MNIYLHIGNNYMLLKNKITAIFDLDKTSAHKVTRDFLEKAQKDSKIVAATDDIPRSFIIADGKVYLSQLSAQTLNERFMSEQ